MDKKLLFFFSGIIFFISLGLFMRNPFAFLVFDDFNHLARAKWSVFGEKKITELQREEPLNYIWSLHSLLSIFCRADDEISEEEKTTEKSNQRCIRAYLVLKSLVISLMFLSLSLVLMSSGFLRNILGFVFPAGIIFILMHTQVMRTISYMIMLLYIHFLVGRKYIYIPFLQVLWSNIHIFATFGPPMIFASALIEKKRKEKKELLLLSFVCFLASLLNPYHIKIYAEIIDSAFVFFTGVFVSENNFSRIYELRSLLNFGSWLTKMKLIAYAFFVATQISSLEVMKSLIFSPLLALPIFIRVFFLIPVLFTANYMRKFGVLTFIFSLAFCVFSFRLFIYYMNFYEGFNTRARQLILSDWFQRRCSGVVHSPFPSMVVFYLFPKAKAYYDFFTSWNIKDKFRSSGDTYEELARADVSCIISSPQFYRRTPFRFPRAVIWSDGYFRVVDFRIVRELYLGY